MPPTPDVLRTNRCEPSGAQTGASINGVQTTMYALAAHVYPSIVRASGVGSAVAFGRSGAILVGYVGPWTIALGGTTAFFGAVAVMMKERDMG